ncbi:hypothetical protein NG99_01465 [Erwinia typographi]|uniref:Glycosyl transferase family 1 domain-containing protein n=1 Tax=Erwinia typographi TaxID=371042 RepID=A0A0A3ZDU4_9GAMM|nr:glycosyltransferase family 4 protein [Erwinia typographi]KGT95836.1 hypothetical protein NG99_01465 [Erwinia typographi]
MIIGLANNAYPEKRCITCNDGNTFINLKKNNFYTYLNFVQAKMGITQPNFIFRPIFSLKKHRLDLFHFFNHIPITDMMWAVTFETAVPRIRENITLHRVRDGENLMLPNAKTRKMLSLAARDNCIALIAISECAKKIQMALLSCYPDLEQQIASKVRVVHPPQTLFTEVKHRHDSKINFMFIGKDFYRKGGAEVLLAFSELYQDGIINAEQVSLNIIGDTQQKQNYLHGRFPDDEAFYQKLDEIQRTLPFLQAYQSLPNQQVIEMMQRTDIGLLPSWGDTYGYSVLEMQACGCPVVTTNVRAMPEINGDDAGWLIDLKLNRFGELLIDTAEDKRRTRDKIVSSLKKIIVDVVNNPQLIPVRANKSIERIKLQHDPERYKQTLDNIYQQ